MQVLLTLLLTAAPAVAFAGQFEDYAYSEPAHEWLYNTRTGQRLSLAEAAGELRPGAIVVLGEVHATPQSQSDPDSRLHHDNQLRFLLAREMRLGMEFLEYPDQRHVDDFLAGNKNESEFLTAVRWGGSPFAPYGRLMQATRAQGTVALNIPRGISRQVARGGPESLSPEQRAFLPPLWERGASAYFERFAATMQGHVPAEAIERYFWAQSLWDDTMAWRAIESHSSDEVLMIVVGQFHAEFGHGLPARLKRQGAQDVRTIVQVQLTDWTEEAIEAATQPDPLYGHRADLIWLYKR